MPGLAGCYRGFVKLAFAVGLFFDFLKLPVDIPIGFFRAITQQYIHLQLSVRILGQLPQI